jgi:hypothetical protein
MQMITGMNPESREEEVKILPSMRSAWLLIAVSALLANPIASPRLLAQFVDEWRPGQFLPHHYEAEGDPTVPHLSAGAAHIRSIVSRPRWLATISSTILGKPFSGKRVRFSGYLRTVDVENSAGLRLFAEGPHGKPNVFETMEFREITGITGWRRYEIVVDIPESTIVIVPGFYLCGQGSVWADGFMFEAVNSTVALTSLDPISAFVMGDSLEARRIFRKTVLENPENLFFQLYWYMAKSGYGAAK